MDQLKAEKKVYSLKISRYELWFHKKQKEKQLLTRQEFQNHPIFPFLSTFLDLLETSPANKVINWKEFGLNLGKIFGFEPYFPNLRYFVIEDPLKIFDLTKELYPSILSQILIFLGDEKFEIDPPITQKETNTIIFRIRGSKYHENKIFFNLLCGIEEAEISHILPFQVKIDVLQQITDKKLVDINFKILLDKEILNE